MTFSYNKLLRLSSSSRAKYSQGEILNMMEGDSDKLEDASTHSYPFLFTLRYIQTIWSGLFKIIISLIMLYRRVSSISSPHT